MSLISSSGRRARRAFAPSVSGLEDRKLLAGSIAFDGTALYFRSDVGESHATLAPSETTPGNLVATIDGQSQEFSAAAVKLVFFFSSEEGGDSFENTTNELSISLLYGTGNTAIGGYGSDIVLDYAGDSAVDSNGGMVNVIDASDPTVGHSIGFVPTRSGGFTVHVR